MSLKVVLFLELFVLATSFGDYASDDQGSNDRYIVYRVEKKYIGDDVKAQIKNEFKPVYLPSADLTHSILIDTDQQLTFEKYLSEKKIPFVIENGSFGTNTQSLTKGSVKAKIKKRSIPLYYYDDERFGDERNYVHKPVPGKAPVISSAKKNDKSADGGIQQNIFPLNTTSDDLDDQLKKATESNLITEVADESVEDVDNLFNLYFYLTVTIFLIVIIWLCFSKKIVL